MKPPNESSDQQLTRDDNHALLLPSEARASLAARGRTDASLLYSDIQPWRIDLFPLWRVRQEAETGDSDAQNELGDRYREGHDVSRDPVQAATWYQKASEQRHLYAFFSLGEMYEKGDGVPQDLTEARRCFSVAADDDLDQSEWDPDVVAEMWKRAAKLGDAYAQYLHGTECVRWKEHYSDSDRAPFEAEAAYWYGMAADQGNIYGQLAIAHSYEEGKGLPRDQTKAAEWYRKAAEIGDKVGDEHPRLLYKAFLRRCGPGGQR